VAKLSSQILYTSLHSIFFISFVFYFLCIFPWFFFSRGFSVLKVFLRILFLPRFKSRCKRLKFRRSLKEDILKKYGRVIPKALASWIGKSKIETKKVRLAWWEHRPKKVNGRRSKVGFKKVRRIEFWASSFELELKF